ncbi:hypothetical protein GOV14_06025 [Candidatus Pacearchaeota archaeon]|nr:hypothetical protein [Candidatus Pacearchaeota archaeon]
MNNKEKIRLLEKYIENYQNFKLPLGLDKELSIYSNRFGIKSIEGALSYLGELKREERDKVIINIQRKQTEFNRILALATTVLALGVFIEWIIKLFENPGMLIGRSSFTEFVLIGLPMVVIVLITIELVRIYYLNANWRREVK